MGEDLESWAKIIRSTVLTSKTPLTPYEINRDMKMLEGKEIPFRQLGFRSLEEMLQKISGLRVFQAQNKTLVQAIASAETAHIQSMVMRQKSSKKKPRTLPSKYNTYNRKPTFAQNNQNRYYSTPQRRNNNYNNSYSHPNSNTNLSKFNVPNNRPSSTEPTKKFTPTPTSQSYNKPTSVPVPKNSDPPKKSPSPITQSTPVSSMKFTPPQKSVHFSPNLQSAPSPACNVQQRLNIAKQQPVQAVPRSLLEPITVAVAAPQPLSTTPISQASKTSNLAQRLKVTSPPKISTAEDPRLRLHSYTVARNLPLPIYKDLPTKNKFIYSSVTVDSKKYSSYPREAKTKDEAEKFAAEVALAKLLDDKKPTIVTHDKKLIVERVLEIVNQHPNGLFETSVVESYVEKFRQGLPDDWLKIVESSITIDTGATNVTILSPQSNELHKTRSPSSTTLIEPGVLNVKDMDEFWMRIYVVYNTNDVWGVIIDESDKTVELAKEMKAYYEADTSIASNVIPGRYYTIYDSEWHRVRCNKVDPETQIASVFFIDRGDEDEFPVSQLRTLNQKFCLLPAQSVRLSMDGFELFEDCIEAQKFLDELIVDKDVFVKNMRHNTGVISAQLYLLREDVEVNVNSLLMAELVEKIVDPLPLFGPDQTAHPVFLSHISDEKIYVQVQGKGSTYLNSHMDILTKEHLNNTYYKHGAVLKFDASKIYVTKSEDNNWYRVKITKIENENLAEVICIDVGETIKVHRSALISLEEMSELLSKYPAQAIQVGLHKISPIMFDKHMSDHLRKLAPKTSLFYMKVVGHHNNLPMVEFYKRTESNLLASLNDTLALSPEIISKDNNNNAKPRTRSDCSSFVSRSEFPLKAPTIPAINNFFDVHITMAAHPGNFTVQPLNSLKSLTKLMAELSDVCNTYTGPALTPGCLKAGSMYAAKYDDDGRWYRAYVSKVISKTICAVYFCDFGDYRAVSIEQMQPLQQQFYELPYQALKATLHGIVPKLKGDWNVKDSLRFNDLIVDKNFVSIIKSCNIDVNSTTDDMILGLELIDTSTPDDIYISNVLVSENRAEKLVES